MFDTKLIGVRMKFGIDLKIAIWLLFAVVILALGFQFSWKVVLTSSIIIAILGNSIATKCYRVAAWGALGAIASWFTYMIAATLGTGTLVFFDDVFNPYSVDWWTLGATMGFLVWYLKEGSNAK
jgi:hypothetical protein